ncbi:MAG: hypothetical protein PHV00_05955 [Syntrophales bacterium]|nr:hypothetical protein [Syntrophales bacterium]
MDGRELTRAVLDFTDGYTAAGKEDKQRRIYECLDAAAAIFLRETRILHTSADLTTVEDQQDYDLPPDFIDLYMADRANRFFIRYYDGSNYSWPLCTSYEEIFRENKTESQSIPNRFCIRDKDDVEAAVTGNTSAAGAASHGQCILTDATQTFTTTHRVQARDIVHNETDNSDGVVLSVTDATHLVTALFGGTNNAWTSGDVYRIQPATERELYLDAPSETAGHILRVPYVCMPTPVYSDYGAWRFPPRVCRAIASGAAALLVLPESSYDESRVMQGLFLDEIRRLRAERAQAILDQGRSRRRGW